MGRNALTIDNQIAEFTTKCIPKRLSRKHVEADEIPFVEVYKLGPKEYPTHTSFFK